MTLLEDKGRAEDVQRGMSILGLNNGRPLLRGANILDAAIHLKIALLTVGTGQLLNAAIETLWRAQYVQYPPIRIYITLATLGFYFIYLSIFLKLRAGKKLD